MNRTSKKYDSLVVTMRVPGETNAMEFNLEGVLLNYYPGKIESRLTLDGVIADKQAVRISDTSGPESIFDIHREWENCTACDLHRNRRRTVLGDGNTKDAKILIIGEAPGSEEDERGIPFCGSTGQLLRRTLMQVGIVPSEDCFITNTVACFPTPDGRSIAKPTTDQMLTCRARLNRQFMALNQSLRAVLLVGKYSYVQFFKRQEMERGEFDTPAQIERLKISDVLGWHTGVLPWPDIRVMTVYHPSYLQRQKVTESSPLFVEWRRDLQALKDWALHGKFWDPRPVRI